ncbi:MAG: RNA polymerase sigma factor [Ruminiclostridium sp.]|nr:RNA polymerase sigma factor [Ruminiclostridium sp.]
MNEEELKKYISLFHGTIYRLAFSYLRNYADAEDVCQEAFIKLYNYKGRFESDENCKAWLIRVSVNISKNILKSSWFLKRTELDENIPVETDEEYELIEKIMKLPKKYRLIIHLYYFEGYSVKEISKLTGTPVSTVTTQLSRARKQLKEAILKEGL